MKEAKRNNLGIIKRSLYNYGFFLLLSLFTITINDYFAKVAFFAWAFVLFNVAISYKKIFHNVFVATFILLAPIALGHLLTDLVGETVHNMWNMRLNVNVDGYFGLQDLKFYIYPYIFYMLLGTPLFFFLREKDKVRRKKAPKKQEYQGDINPVF